MVANIDHAQVSGIGLTLPTGDIGSFNPCNLRTWYPVPTASQHGPPRCQAYLQSKQQPTPAPMSGLGLSRRPSRGAKLVPPTELGHPSGMGLLGSSPSPPRASSSGSGSPTLSSSAEPETEVESFGQLEAIEASCWRGTALGLLMVHWMGILTGGEERKLTPPCGSLRVRL